jgi:hypothetical protein
MYYQLHTKFTLTLVVATTFSARAIADHHVDEVARAPAPEGTRLDALPDGADELRNAIPWLEYEHTGGFVYTRVAVGFFSHGAVRVLIDRKADERAFEYTATLSGPETAWFRTVVRTTDFSNPKRIEGESPFFEGGITTVRARIDGQNVEATFGRDDAIDDLSRIIFRVLRQAEMLKHLEDGGKPVPVYSALTGNQVLQPEAFVEPLTAYVLRENDQLDHALLGLAKITTAEQWGGVLAQALEEASDVPYREGSSFSRRRALLNWITLSSFYLSLPDSHVDALLRIYRVQSTIESQKTDDDRAARYIRMFKESEKRMKARKAE